MTLRYDDPRVLRAGNEAYGAFVRAAGWAESHGTRELSREAARLVAPVRVWRRLAQAGLVAELPGGAWGLDTAPRRSGIDAATPAQPEAAKSPLTPAERARLYRKRHASRVTPSRDDRHAAVTESVTESVTSSRDASAPVSLSDLEEDEKKRDERETREGEPSRNVVTVHTFAPTLPAPDSAAPEWVHGIVEAFVMGRGVKLDARLEWQTFLANAHKRRSQGLPSSATEHDFRLWVGGSVKRASNAPARAPHRRAAVQGGPRNPGLLPSWEDDDA